MERAALPHCTRLPSSRSGKASQKASRFVVAQSAASGPFFCRANVLSVETLVLEPLAKTFRGFALN